uniref:Uncharacterized protein n=1 Tax=Arundo donax TaxID=35708 RepID=A0A0A9A0N2_ARUDO
MARERYVFFVFFHCKVCQYSHADMTALLSLKNMLIISSS